MNTERSNKHCDMTYDSSVVQTECLVKLIIRQTWDSTRDRSTGGLPNHKSTSRESNKATQGRLTNYTTHSPHTGYSTPFPTDPPILPLVQLNFHHSQPTIPDRPYSHLHPQRPFRRLRSFERRGKKRLKWGRVGQMG